MKETLIEFETAKLAFEKGFDDRELDFMSNITKDYYRKDGSKIELKRSESYSWIRGEESEPIMCVTQSLLQKWLREKHNLYVEPEINNAGIYVNIYEVKKSVEMIKTYGPDGGYDTYEIALEKGLYEALQLINNK